MNEDPDPTEPAPVNEDPDPTEPEEPEETVKQADVPKTGDLSVLWTTASVLSAGGMVMLGKKRKEE